MKGTIVGQISQIGEDQFFGENGFKKRELIIKTVEEYPNIYLIEFQKDKTDLLSEFKTGQVVKVKCNLKGREYTNDKQEYNVFMSLQGWSIEEHNS